MQSRPAGKVVVWLTLLALVALQFGGCGMRGGTRDIPQSRAVGGDQRRSVTTTPLSVRVADASQLAMVVSVLVLPPSFSSGVQSSPSTASYIVDRLESIAERELAVAVLGKRWMEESPERMRLVREASRAPSLASLQQQGVDAILRTEVTSFVERRGSSVGGEPADVSFVMTLVRSSDSRELWQGTFSYGQTFLSDNVLQLGDVVGERRRGPGWISGSEIFEAGVSSALKDLNTRREQQFLARK
jgi:hypothetical protein